MTDEQQDAAALSRLRAWQAVTGREGRQYVVSAPHWVSSSYTVCLYGRQWMYQNVQTQNDSLYAAVDAALTVWDERGQG